MESYEEKKVRINKTAESMDLDLQSLVDIVATTNGNILYYWDAGEVHISFELRVAGPNQEEGENEIILKDSFPPVSIDLEVRYDDLRELRY